MLIITYGEISSKLLNNFNEIELLNINVSITKLLSKVNLPDDFLTKNIEDQLKDLAKAKKGIINHAFSYSIKRAISRNMADGRDDIQNKGKTIFCLSYMSKKCSSFGCAPKVQIGSIKDLLNEYKIVTQNKDKGTLELNNFRTIENSIILFATFDCILDVLDNTEKDRLEIESLIDNRKGTNRCFIHFSNLT
jgi:hypothetical protein